MEVSFKTVTSKKSIVEVQNSACFNKVAIKIDRDGDTFIEEQHFEFKSKRNVIDDYIMESTLDLGRGEKRVCVKTIYGKNNTVFEVDSSCGVRNVQVATLESTFQLLVLLGNEPKEVAEGEWESDDDMGFNLFD